MSHYLVDSPNTKYIVIKYQTIIVKKHFRFINKNYLKVCFTEEPKGKLYLQRNKIKMESRYCYATKEQSAV